MCLRASAFSPPLKLPLWKVQKRQGMPRALCFPLCSNVVTPPTICLLYDNILRPIHVYAVSGEVPQDPVVCSKTGHLYERRLIEKHIDEVGTDPVTKEEISLQDLISVKSTFRLDVCR